MKKIYRCPMCNTNALTYIVNDFFKYKNTRLNAKIIVGHCKECNWEFVCSDADEARDKAIKEYNLSKKKD